MNFLAIDTTMSQLAIAISVGSKEKAITIDIPSKKHNSTLMVEVDKILKAMDATINDIDVFGVVTGPGSFTGIRIGVATVNAFSFALKKKIIEITALELAVYFHRNKRALALIDCRNNNYYGGLLADEKIKYMEVKADNIERYDAETIFYEKPDSNALLNIMKEKIDKGQFVNKAQPFYMKKSSAERNYEKKK